MGEPRTNESGKWYSVTFRGTAEMTVWLKADSSKEAREKADEGDYGDSTQVEFVKGRPFTMKVRRDDDYNPDTWDG